MSDAGNRTFDSAPPCLHPFVPPCRPCHATECDKMRHFSRRKCFICQFLAPNPLLILIIILIAILLYSRPLPGGDVADMQLSQPPIRTVRFRPAHDQLAEIAVKRVEQVVALARTITLGTRSTTDSPAATRTSPIARTLAGVGRRLQLAGRSFGFSAAGTGTGAPPTRRALVAAAGRTPPHTSPPSPEKILREGRPPRSGRCALANAGCPRS